MIFRLIKKRTVIVPTWQGGLLTLLLCAGLIAAVFASAYPFLAPEAPPKHGLLVVEGWIPDYALEEVLEIYQKGNYEKIISTGTPIELGSFLLQWESLAQMTTARLTEAGISSNRIVTAIGNDVQRDRTYAAACAMKKQLSACKITETNIHLISVGPHGRRSRLLYQKALGPDYQIGITCIKPQEYDPDRWWAYSNGVRSIISESIAYLYAKLIFHP